MKSQMLYHHGLHAFIIHASERVCLSVCLSARIPQEHISKLHQSLCTLWSWFGHSHFFGGVAIRRVRTSGFVDDVSHNGGVKRTYTETDTPGCSTRGEV